MVFVVDGAVFVMGETVFATDGAVSLQNRQPITGLSVMRKGAPMALSEKDVRGIAEYAKIALTDDELTQMTSYMNDAVQMLEPVLQYDLPDVEPTFHPIGSLSNVMGDDLREPERDLPLDVALENAGSARDRYFRVPSILGEGESE